METKDSRTLPHALFERKKFAWRGKGGEVVSKINRGWLFLRLQRFFLISGNFPLSFKLSLSVTNFFA